MVMLELPVEMANRARLRRPRHHARCAGRRRDRAADVACARPSPGPGDAVQVAISCSTAERAGREPVSRVAVELLRDAGAQCAVVLAGADGLVHGMRRRVRLFSTEGGALHIVAVVPRTSAPEARDDKLTADHGTVTCLPLPGYRERAANTVRCELRLGWS